jgi:hypothetical protein
MMFTKLPDPTILAPYLSAFDCVLKPGKTAIYCSSELTSGQRWNLVLKKYERYFQTNMASNKGWSARFVKIVRHGLNDGTEVIDPGPLDVPDWKGDQKLYYAFWETLIRNHVREVRFNQDWQFSSGCTYEFAVAFDAHIPTLDSEGTELSPYAAIEMVQKAVASLKEDGFDTAKIQNHLQLMQSVVSIDPEQGSSQDRPSV